LSRRGTAAKGSARIAYGSGAGEDEQGITDQLAVSDLTQGADADKGNEDDMESILLLQPETRPITHEQLVVEVKGIYAGLVLVESKCIEMEENFKAASNEGLLLHKKLSNEQWQALVHLHKTLLHDHHDLYLASQHPSLRSSIKKDTIQTHRPPARPSLVKKPARSIRVLEGFVDGKYVQAKPDTGAQANFMSLSFAESLGLALDQEDLEFRIGFPMANGQKIWSVAQVSARWRFKNAMSDSYELKFFVLEKLTYDVVIGDEFLQATQTMSVYDHRLSWAPRSKSILHIRHVNLLGDPNQRIRGILDEKSASALPDSGAEPNLVSYDYAKRRGWLTRRLSGDRNLLQYPDGSLSKTEGQVHAIWRFHREQESHAKRAVSFEVVRNLRFDIVLGQEFLEDTNAYTEQTECFHEASSKDQAIGFCLVIWHSGKREQSLNEPGK